MGSVQPRSTTFVRLLLTGLAGLLLAAAGCGSGSDPSPSPAAAQDPSLVQPRTVPARAPAGSLADVRLRLQDRGYRFEEGFPSGQATDALVVTAGVGVDVAAFDRPRAARIAYRAALRLLRWNPGHGLAAPGGATRLYVTSANRRLTRQERRLFHEVVAAGEGAR